MATGNPEAPKYNGVEVNHPDLVSAARNAAKMGWDREKAKRVTGLPQEIVNKIYHEVGVVKDK